MGGGGAAPAPTPPRPPAPGPSPRDRALTPRGGDAECCIFHRKKAFDESSDESEGECDCDLNAYEKPPPVRPRDGGDPSAGGGGAAQPVF